MGTLKNIKLSMLGRVTAKEINSRSYYTGVIMPIISAYDVLYNDKTESISFKDTGIISNEKFSTFFEFSNLDNVLVFEAGEYYKDGIDNVPEENLRVSIVVEKPKKTKDFFRIRYIIDSIDGYIKEEMTKFLNVNAKISDFLTLSKSVINGYAE